jgi:hypothetical protein
MSIPLVTHLPLFQDNFWFRFLSPKRKKGHWVFWNRPQQDGEGRTIFLTVMAWSLLHKALKLTKETDQTQYPQLILTSMMVKDTD